MNERLLLKIGLCAVSMATLCGVVFQHRTLVDLRAEQQRRVAQLDSSVEIATPSAPAKLEPESSVPKSASSELLQLRNEVNQLTRRSRELQGVQAENERLRTQVQARKTNATQQLPGNFIRMSQARRAGYSTPEQTLETFLWAFKNRDVAAFERGLTGESAAQFEKEMKNQGGADDFFAHAPELPGLSVLGRKQLPDGTIELSVGIMEGESHPMIFEQVNGEWKIRGPF